MTVTEGFQTIQYRVADGVAHLVFNRPASLNAINPQMMREIIAAAGLINADPAVRVAILSGAGGRAFSAGHDLKERDPGPALHHQAIASIDRPTIAAIGGYAIGGVLEAALACDLRVAADDAKLGLPEVRRGLMPRAGGTQRLSRLVGPGHALRIALSGELIDAREAHRIGLVNEVVPRDQLMSAAVGLARAIGLGAPLATRFVKEAINAGYGMSLADGLRLEADLAARNGATADAQEGVRAFAEKRTPEWRGR